MRKGVAGSAAALTLFAFLASPAVALACGGMESAHDHGQQTAQTLISTATASTGSAPMTPKPETTAN
jgi:hypothetical protein